MLTPTNLANHSTTTKRRELDFYPTPPEVTHALMRFLKLSTNLRILEPACGTGEMAEVIRMYNKEVYAYDLRETGYRYNQNKPQDFLTEQWSFDAIITNPPFNLAEQFIRHALNQAPIVAMLLKSQYWHAKTRTPLFKEHPPAWVLPLNWRPDFRAGELGGSPTMEVAWTVWDADCTDTRYRILEKPDMNRIDADLWARAELRKDWCIAEDTPDLWAKHPFFKPKEEEDDLC